LDLLRGIAVLAILPANIPFFATFTSMDGSTKLPENASWADRAAVAATQVFVEGKFITLLSILFGAGLAIQADRARAAGRPFVGYYLRRLALLFAIGLAHGLLLWFGDILSSYAIVGVGALFLGRLGQRGLQWAMAGCFTWAYSGILGFIFLVWYFGDALPKPPQAGDSPPATAQSPLDAKDVQADRIGQVVQEYFGEANTTRIYREGPYWEMVLNRAVNLAGTAVSFWIVIGWYLLGCFLFGIWLLRHGVFHNGTKHRRLLLGFVVVGLLIGAPLQVCYAIAHARNPNSVVPAVYWVCGAPLLAVGYLGLFSFWSLSGRVEWLQRRFRAVGRMALTNYLLQSVICTTLFYSYGFALFGQLGRGPLLLVVAGVWLFELALSPVWLHFFRMGPVEWIWRSLAEGQRKPFLRTA
jgi:uncharacterized protein